MEVVQRIKILQHMITGFLQTKLRSFPIFKLKNIYI